MRVVAWNVKRNGPDLLDRLDNLAPGPDVAVLPEFGRCPINAPQGRSLVGFGTAGRYGLAVAGWGDWTVRPADVPPIVGGVVGAVDVDGPTPFRLIAVWSYLSGRPPPSVNPVIEAVDTWRDWLADGPVIVAGDFNTGGAWPAGSTHPSLDHFPIVERLAALGLRSCFHAFAGLEQGVGEPPTFFDNQGGTHCIDHVFAPAEWAVAGVEVGNRDTSDHAPVIVDLDIGELLRAAADDA